jgi:hypothetical protein
MRVGVKEWLMLSPLFMPLALFATAALLLTILKAARLRDLEAEIRRRVQQEEMMHQRTMKELETELERTKEWKSLNLRVLDLQKKQ